MTINRLKGRKRRSAAKRMIPALLAVALIFTAVASYGYALFSDTLKISTTVHVAKKPLTVKMERTNVDTFTAQDDGYRFGTATDNYWIAFQAAIDNTVVPSRSFLTYEVQGKWDDVDTFTIYNALLKNTNYGRYTSWGMLENKGSDTYGGTYYLWQNYTIALLATGGNAGPEISFGRDRYALDAASGGDYGFHPPAALPIKVTVSNPNNSSVNITGISCPSAHTSGISFPKEVRANQSITFTLYPDTYSGTINVTINTNDADNSSVAAKVVFEKDD